MNINELREHGNSAPLYHRYPGQSREQEAYVSIALSPDADPVVTADWDPEIGNAVPFKVWHGKTRRISVSPYLRGSALADFLDSDKIRALIERVDAGYTERWNGNNHIGEPDEDAEDAMEALQRAFDDFAYAPGALVEFEDEEEGGTDERTHAGTVGSDH